MRDDLYSPGAQLAARARLEQETEREFGWVLGLFLADAQAMALASLSEATAVVPFTAGVLTAEWEAYARQAAGRVVTPGSEDHAEVLALLLASGIPATVYSSAQAVLEEGRVSGWSRRRIGQELAAALSPDAALTVREPEPPAESGGAAAVLATVGQSLGTMVALAAVGAATMLAARRFQRRAQEAGVELQRWVTRRDAKVRATHAAADGQTVPVGGLFMVGGYSLRYPGDSWAPVHETANCRCHLVAVAP